MASLSGINKLIKLQKFLIPINVYNSALGSSAYACTMMNVNQKRTLQTMLPRTLNNYVTRRNLADKSIEDQLNEFREREEKREREWSAHEKTQQQTADTGTGEDDAKRAKVDEVRRKVLDAALLHVPTLGWTRSAIIQGAEESGYPSVVHGMFPEGGYALVSHFNGKCNAELVQILRGETQNGQKHIDNPVEFLVSAVRQRLEMIIPYKSQWPQALALIAKPDNASTSLAQVLTLVDDICYYSGDRSVDIGWYTRRIGLATIMKMTELYMLQDNSPEHAKTWEFLKNRMDEAVQLQTMLSQTGDMTHSFQRSFNSAFVTNALLGTISNVMAVANTLHKKITTGRMA